MATPTTTTTSNRFESFADSLLCSNCGGRFMTITAFNVHFSSKRPACAYGLNEPVINLQEFTAEALNASVGQQTAV